MMAVTNDPNDDGGPLTVRSLLPLCVCHLGTHIGAVVSLGAGAVSFTHIVKASEPVVSAALTGIVSRTFSLSVRIAMHSVACCAAWVCAAVTLN